VLKAAFPFLADAAGAESRGRAPAPTRGALWEQALARLGRGLGELEEIYTEEQLEVLFRKAAERRRRETKAEARRLTSAVHTAIAVSLDRDAAAAYARQTAAEDRAEQRVDRLERRAPARPTSRPRAPASTA
jgi:hypothetical protein